MTLRGTAHYKWWALSATSLGMLMAVLNGTTLLIALPTLVRALHMSAFLSIWVLLAYMVVQTVLVLTVGRLSDIFGRKRLYVMGFALFTIAALAAGLAPNGVTLLMIRAVQAVGGALVIGNATAIVSDAFPRQQLGLALGINSIVIALGQVLGPILGGLLITVLPWHWVFWFNVPIGVLGTIWASIQLKDVVAPTREPKIDYVGNAAYMIGLTSLLVGVTAGGIDGWENPLSVGPITVSMAAWVAFFVAEKRAAYPLFNLSLFKNRPFTMDNVANLLIAMGRGAIVLLFVFYFQGGRGYSPLEAGILVIPLAIAMGVTAPFSGWIADRVGARGPASLGALMVGAGLLGFAATITLTSSYAIIAAWMVVVGIGNGLFNSPNTSSIMNAVSANQRGVAAGTRTMLLNTGNVFSTAFVLALIASKLPAPVMMAILSGTTASLSQSQLGSFAEVLRLAFFIMAMVAWAAALLSWLRGSAQPRAQMKSMDRVPRVS